MALKIVIKFRTHTLHRTEIALSGAQQGHMIYKIIVILNILYILSSEHCVLGVPADITGRDVS